MIVPLAPSHVVTTIPIDRISKRPACKWRHLRRGESIAARTDQDVGILTGERSDLEIVDYDPRHDPTGAGWAILVQLGAPETATVRTRSGGAHFYFFVPTNGAIVRNSVSKIGPGIDVRGEGGYGKCWPSPGYELVRAVVPLPCPRWLVDASAPTPRSSPLLTPKPLGTASSALVLAAESTLANAISDLLRATSGGNDLLVRLAFDLGGYVGAGALDPMRTESALANAISSWDDLERHYDSLRRALEAGFEAPHEEIEEIQIARLPKKNFVDLCAQEPARFLRIPTGHTQFDWSTGGGFRTGQISLLGGPPGGNKTSWLTSLALGWARDGVDTSSWSARLSTAIKPRESVAVAIVACDETRSGILSRLGQMAGRISRVELDDEDPSVSTPAWERVAGYLPENLSIWDPREDPEITVERVAIDLALAKASRKILLIDSIQSLFGWGCDDPRDDTRIKINKRIGVLAHLVRTLRIAIVATSELARSGYAAGAEINMGALKESGALEYLGDQVIVLRSIDHETFEIHTLKTRTGNVSVTQMHRGTWLEFTEQEIKQDVDSIDGTVKKICDALAREQTPIRTATSVIALASVRKERGLAALQVAVGRGLVFQDGDYYAIGAAK